MNGPFSSARFQASQLGIVRQKMDTVYLARGVALESAETVEQGIGWPVRESGATVGLGSEIEVGTLQVKTR
jgi:hypothetical protein